MAVATYRIQMEGEQPVEVAVKYLLAPDPSKAITAWCERTGKRAHDCVTDSVVPRDKFSFYYEPKKGGLFSGRARYLVNAYRIDQ